MSDFNTPEWDKKFHSIFADIRQNKCVVLVGPEIVKIGERTLSDVLRNHLQLTNADDIVHFYERDGFFLFKDQTAKGAVLREVVEFYKNHTLDTDVGEHLLLQLARLHVHVILSINPDALLSDVAYKYGIKHRFAYFQHGGTSVQDVEIPSTEMPLFYNLFGSIERDESLVLDYDDLYRLLSSLLGSPKLPNNLKFAVSTKERYARHFLFIGFDFDKWYSQLLLKLLGDEHEKAIQKFVIDSSKKNPSTTTFLKSQFNIQFIEDEQAFLKEFFRRAETEGLMREITEAKTPDAARITRFLQNGDVLNALNLLKANKKAQQTAILLLAQYHELKAREKSMDSRDYWPQYFRIMDAILETLKTDF